MKHLKTKKVFEGKIKEIALKIDNEDLLTKDEFAVAQNAGYKGVKEGEMYRIIKEPNKRTK